MQVTGSNLPCIMATVVDILQHIAQTLNLVRERTPRAGVDDIPTGKNFKLRLCVTADVEATELAYMQQYGRGHTLYFRLRNLEQAQKLTSDLFEKIGTLYPDASIYSPLDTPDAERLYLFIHIRYGSRRKLKIRGLGRTLLRLPFTFYRA
jgi:hypothetical protein